MIVNQRGKVIFPPLVIFGMKKKQKTSHGMKKKQKTSHGMKKKQKHSHGLTRNYTEKTEAETRKESQEEA
jgi:hypothetical protein